VSAAAEVLAQVRAAGGDVCLKPDGGLRVVAPAPLPTELMARVRASKAALAGLLISPTSPEPEEGPRQPGKTPFTVGGPPPPRRPQMGAVERAKWARVADQITGRLRLRVRGNASPEQWHQFCDDAHRFIDQGWWHRAFALGWDRLELVGVNRIAPWARYDHMGLVLLIRGGQVIGMDERTAKIETPTGAHQSYRRAPLNRGEVVLIDEIA